jgi:hypothetical protein
LAGYYGYARANWGAFQNPYGGSAMTASSGGGGSGGGGSGGGGEGGAYPASGSAAAAPATYVADGPSLRSNKVGYAGTFDEDGKMEWPLALRILPPAEETAALRGEIENSMRGGGKASNEACLAIARLQRLLARNADRLPVSSESVAQAKRFLRNLNAAAQASR